MEQSTYENVMCDLETFGKNRSAPVIAIGAVAFDPFGGDFECGASFYRIIKLKSTVAQGAVIDPDTVMWWMKQSDEARAKLVRSDAVDIGQALSEFGLWINRHTVGSHDVKLWGNGAAFDNVILGEAYDRAGIERPWKFWNDRCYRTLKNLHPDVVMRRDGTHHDALDDAYSQARHACEILKRYEVAQPTPAGFTEGADLVV